MLHRFSKYVVEYLAELAHAPSISDEEYANRLLEGVAMLFNFRMLAYTITPKPVQEEWLKTTVGVEFVRMMPKLFPEERDISPHLFKGMSSEEIAIYESKDVEEAADRLIEYLSKVFEKITKK